MKKLSIIFFLALSVTVCAQKQVTIEDFTTENTFNQKSISGINWMKDGKFYSTLESNKIVKYNMTSGQAVETIFDGATATPKVDIRSYSFSEDEKKILLLTNYEGIYRRSFRADYFVYDVASKAIHKLSEKGKQSYASLSADNSKIAFVRDNNLFYVNLTDWSEVQITDD